MDISALPRTIELTWGSDGRALLTSIDQRRLPSQLTFQHLYDYVSVIDAIKTLALRGAPALGVGGAAAVALYAINESESSGTEELLSELTTVKSIVAKARPTAVNLAWGVKRAFDVACTMSSNGALLDEIKKGLFDLVKELEIEDEATNRAIGAYGSDLLAPDSRILTHCNAGSLATVFYGTALGVVYAAAEHGKIARVFADETRPVGQGVRLTAWELARVGIPCTLICDSMAASVMASDRIDAVIVGADRIAQNGDTANKIGTYGLAVLAGYHNIPFYVAAPTSTIDLSTTHGLDIPIEQRTPSEVSPYEMAGVDIYNPAFDVTPAALIAAIITERGVFSPSDIVSATKPCEDPCV